MKPCRYYDYYHHKSHKRVTMRTVDLKEDLERLHEWTNYPHAIPNWQLNKSKQALYQHFRKALEDKHQMLFIVAIDGKELCYAELYYAPHDRLANFCKVNDGDYGWHLLIGPPDEVGKGHSEAIFCALTDYLFQHQNAKRVLVEPNQRVLQFSLLQRKLGFVNLGHIKLPEKTAILYAANREQFYKITNDVNSWPLVRMHFPDHPSDLAVQNWLEELDQLLQRKVPCVVITTFGKYYQFSPYGRRKQALWFRRNKSLLKSYCLGMVRVTEDKEMIAKITSNAMRKGMPFICTPANTIAHAEEIAIALLKQHHLG